MNASVLLPLAAALGGHLLHAAVIGGAVLIASLVYAVATVTAPPAPEQPRTERTTKLRPPGPSPRSAVAQQVAFLGLCAAAGTHLAVMLDHLQQSWIYGAFFAVVAPLQLGLAWMVVARARRAELVGALSFSVAVVGLWAVSRFVGVPIGPDHGATEDFGVLDIFATSCELLTSAALVYLLRSEQLSLSSRLAAVWRWSLWSPTTRTLLAATFVTVPLLSVFASRS